MTILPKWGVLINVHTFLTVNIHTLQKLANRMHDVTVMCGSFPQQMHNVKTGFQSHSKVTCINSGCWILTECALQRCSDCVCNRYYTPDRSLPQIHEVIFNNPEGGARGLIEYYTECIRGRDQSKGCNN